MKYYEDLEDLDYMEFIVGAGGRIQFRFIDGLKPKIDVYIGEVFCVSCYNSKDLNKLNLGLTFSKINHYTNEEIEAVTSKYEEVPFAYGASNSHIHMDKYGVFDYYAEARWKKIPGVKYYNVDDCKAICNELNKEKN